MKRIKILNIVLFMLGLFMILGTVTFAAVNMQEIRAYINYDIKIVKDGLVQSMTDANGNQVYPISYEGTTYVPIRAVSNMLGIAVNWDQENYSVLLGKTDEAVDFIANYTPYAQSNYNHKQAQAINIAGKDYSKFIANNTGGLPGGQASGVYNIEGAYDTFSFDVYSERDAAIYFFGDNDALLGTISVEANQLPESYTIDVTGVQQFTIEIKGNIVFQPTYILNAVLQ